MKRLVLWIGNYISDMSIVLKSFLSYTLVLIIPVTISGLFFYNKYMVNLNVQKDNLMMELVSQHTSGINSKLLSVEYLSDTMISNNLIKQFFYSKGYDAYQKVLEENNIFTPYLSSLMYLNGEIYQVKFYSYDPQIPKGPFIDTVKNVENEDWFKKAAKLKVNNGLWEDTHICRSDLSKKNARVFSYYRNMYLLNLSEPMATVQIDVSVDELFGGLMDTQIEKNGFLFVTDKKNLIITGRSGADDSYTLEKLIIDEIVPGKGKMEIKYLDRSYFVYYESLEKLNLSLASVVPLKEFSGDIDTQRNIFIFIVILSIGILLILAYLLTILNYKKVKKVLVGIRKISDGDLNVRITVKGKDEIGEIASDLNRMAEKLDDTISIAYRSAIAEKKAMLSALQAQTNPHFLFNTLESIKMMAEIREEMQISDSLDKLGKFMRYNISFKSKVVTLKDEMENVNNYFSIQKMRFGDKIKLTVNIPEHLYECRILKFLIQPLVENAIAYGSVNKKAVVDIEIAVFEKAGFLTINVRNTGPAISEDRLMFLRDQITNYRIEESAKANGNGVGLKNIYERLRLYYNEDCGFEINNFSDDKGSGVEVIICFPITEEKVNKNGIQDIDH